jgi:hypothetical protein
VNRLRALLCSTLLLVTLSAALVPSADAGTTPVGGKYRSYAYLATSRSGAAVYINALVHQDSRAGIVGSPNRTVYLQRQLSGHWQNVLVRHTDARGRFTVGFLSAPTYSYRLVVISSSSAWNADSAAASSPLLGGVLHPGQSLVIGSATTALSSPSKGFRLAMEDGGMFGLTQVSIFPSLDWTIEAAVWEITGLPSPGVNDRSRLTMLANGDLALISAAGKPLWSSHTSGAGNALYVQDDGDLVIYNTASQAVWKSATTKVLLLSGSTIPSGTSYVSHTYPQFGPHAIGRLTMQRDGDLVLLGGGKTIWSSNTHIAGSHAAFTSTGVLAVYSPANKLLWHSASYGAYSRMQLLFTPRNGNMQYLPSYNQPASCS